MINFDKQELLNIAHLSALKLEEHEIEAFTEQITAILAYVEQLNKVAIVTQPQRAGNVNIFRQDLAIPTDYSAILAQAPETDENYFVVPKILDEK